MTDNTTIIIAGFVALPPTIAAVAAFWQGKKSSEKATVIIEKTEQIHDLTNSNLTAIKKQLAAADERIALLEQRLLRLTGIMPD